MVRLVAPCAAILTGMEGGFHPTSVCFLTFFPSISSLYNPRSVNLSLRKFELLRSKARVWSLGARYNGFKVHHTVPVDLTRTMLLLNLQPSKKIIATILLLAAVVSTSPIAYSDASLAEIDTLRARGLPEVSSARLCFRS